MNARSLRPLILSVCPILAIGVALPAVAEEFEQHGVHEHGKVTLNAALEGTALVIGLDAPAINVVGFEHAPRTDTEKAAVTAAARLLNAGNGLFGFPGEAKCAFRGSQLMAPHWEEEKADSHSHHEGHEEHEHHADYEASFTFQCEAPTKLTWIEPLILEKLKNVTEARVNVVAPGGQRSDVAKTAHTRIALK
jgi:Protein of unknown function (DUF2796)